MESPILFDGKEYISASRASKKIGYASDYIGQLCRAKKIPGRLIGRTWYVDLDSLVEHKKNRQYGRKKIFDTEPEPLELLTPPFYVESVWNVRLLKKAAATSLVIFTVIGSSFFLEHNAPLVIAEARQGIENIWTIGAKSLTTLSTGFAQGGQLVAASISSGVDKFFNDVAIGFRGLKEIALNKIFMVSVPLKITAVATTNLFSTTISSTNPFSTILTYGSTILTNLSVDPSFVIPQNFTAVYSASVHSAPVSSIYITAIATTVLEKVEKVSNTGKRFLISLSQDFSRSLSRPFQAGRAELAAISAGQTATPLSVSLSNGMNKFFDNIVAGFRGLKEIALNKIFFTPPRLAQSSSPKITEATPSLPSPPSKAMTEVTKV